MELASLRKSEGLLEPGVWLQDLVMTKPLKMEDASLSDPDPSLQPSRPNDLDSPLLTSNMASPVDENGPAS